MERTLLLFPEGILTPSFVPKYHVSDVREIGPSGWSTADAPQVSPSSTLQSGTIRVSARLDEGRAESVFAYTGMYVLAEKPVAHDRLWQFVAQAALRHGYQPSIHAQPHSDDETRGRDGMLHVVTADPTSRKRSVVVYRVQSAVDVAPQGSLPPDEECMDSNGAAHPNARIARATGLITCDRPIWIYGCRSHGSRYNRLKITDPYLFGSKSLNDLDLACLIEMVAQHEAVSSR